MTTTTLVDSPTASGLRPVLPPEPPSRPAPSSIEALGQEIAALAARLHAGTYELLVLLREFDDRTGGTPASPRVPTGCTGVRESTWEPPVKRRVAHTLASLPPISATMQRGVVSYAKVRALTRVATPANESALLTFAQAGTAAHVERLVRAWRRVDDATAAAEAESRHLHRQLSTWTDHDGMVVIRGRLTPELGAVVQRALEAAADRLRSEGQTSPDTGRLAEEVTPAQRRADALGLLAEAALSADLDRGTAGDRYQVMLHIDSAPGVVAGEPSSVAAGELSGVAAGGPSAAPTPERLSGTLEVDHGAVDVSAETSRRISCDASLVPIRHGVDDAVLHIGRKTRTVSPSIRRALHTRDRSCRFPGCTARRCDAHHIEHWVDGGETSLDNLMLLCRRHHRTVHEGGFKLRQLRDGATTFLRPDGSVLEAAPALPASRLESNGGAHLYP